MKKLICLLIILFIGKFSSSQNLLVTYELNFNGTKNYSFLKVFPDKSYFIINQTADEDESGRTLEEDIEGINFIAEINDRVGSVYINQFSDSLLYSREIDFTSVNYIYESKNDLKWSLMDSARQISNYFCRYATCNFRGRVYEVWYTTDIPLQTGPWKLVGLPGLILYAADSTGEVVFEAKKIENHINEEPSINIANEKLMTFEESFFARKKTLKEMQKRIISKAPKGFKISIKSMDAHYIETDL